MISKCIIVKCWIFSFLGNFMKHFLFKLLLVSTSFWTCHKGRVKRPITKHKLVTKHPSNVAMGLCANGSKQIIRNKEGHQILDIISQNQTFFFITISNHGYIGKLIIFLSYECQGIYNKNSFDPILIFGFNLRCLKMYTYCIIWIQFCKGLSKGLI
jgi:hypothetical protein